MATKKNAALEALGLEVVSELPQPYRKERDANKFWSNVADALRSVPEKWVKVKTYSRTTAANTAQQFNDGVRKGFLKDEWEAKALPINDKQSDLYLKYTGS